MALNPPVTMTGEPCRVEGEYFVMKRGGVEFEFAVTGGNKYSGKGYIILTTCRMVAVNKNLSSPFKAFDIPLGLLKSEEFKQPIFGSNYITGVCKPLFDILPGDIKFKIWFTEGGCGTFVPSFLNMVNSLRKNQNKCHDQKLLNTIAAGQFAKAAYIDPNDPSVIFLEQPDIPYNSTTTNQAPVINQNTNTNFSSNSNFSNTNFNSSSNYSSNQNTQNFNNYNNNQNFNNHNNPNNNSFSALNQVPVQNNTSNTNYSQNQNLNNNGNTMSNSEEVNINSYPSFNDISLNNANQNVNYNANQNVNHNSNQNINHNSNQNVNYNPNSNYPDNNLQNLNTVNINNNQNSQANNDPKYFGFWGPQLQKKDNY